MEIHLVKVQAGLRQIDRLVEIIELPRVVMSKCPICRGMAPPPLDYDYNELIVRLISDCYLQIEEFQFTFT